MYEILPRKGLGPHKSFDIDQVRNDSSSFRPGRGALATPATLFARRIDSAIGLAISRTERTSPWISVPTPVPMNNNKQCQFSPEGAVILLIMLKFYCKLEIISIESK